MVLNKNEAVLLVNLGSPKNLDKKSVKQYLKVFLSDDYVVDLPKLLQQLILRAFILPFRPNKTLHAYKQVWTKEGSPLIVSTKKIAMKLAEKTNWNVEIAMRYEEPSIKEALEKLKNQGCKKLFVITLYPHNAMATTITTEVEVRRIANNVFKQLELVFIKPFYGNKQYINALKKSIEPFIEKDHFDKLIFSYHGIPERQAKKTDVTGKHCFSSENCCEIECPGSADCYKAHTVQTTNKVVKELGLDNENWEISYQSRIGPGWLKPFTDKRLSAMPNNGIKSIAIVCPSFISDCLETLEEIDIRGRETFFNAGGEKMTYIPCLNDSENTIELLKTLVVEKIS
ncbi:MAG: ferrochelatase [Actinomycetota bacterium]|nr:ferrochelatase [Actinomycetota bacterium]